MGSSMPYYKTGEILSKAIEMEQKGAAFYSALAAQQTDAATKELFVFLAGEERKHERSFSELMKQHGEFKTELGWDFWDYFAGLQLMSDQGVFEPDTSTVKQTYLAHSPLELVRTALQFERDSILYYSEARSIVHSSAQPVIDELIEQERGHVRQLSRVMRNLQKVV